MTGETPGLRLTNTLTRKKEPFEPIDPANVRMYVCGPTVYDYAHIGNARPIIVFDVFYRLLRHRYGARHVTYVRNITDVDDKINRRAAEEGVPIGEVTARTIRQFHEDIAALGVLPPDVEPRATEHIDEMKAMIEALVENGCAYMAEDHVLFDVASAPRYGQLSHRSLDEMIAGARVEVAPYKKNPMDFVLWKPSKQGEPRWPSPCGIGMQGRPGWHIECSAMSKKHLGDAFDIHGGGADLIFPHHENEIAQSCCAHTAHCPLPTAHTAHTWLHNGYLQVEGEKMSKSLGNFITIHELLKTETFGGRKWPGEVLRLAMLMTHYRQPLNWRVEGLRQANDALRKFAEAVRGAESEPSDANPCEAVIAALSNDLNTPQAIAELHSLANMSTSTQSGDDALAAERQLIWALEFMGFKNHRKLLRENVELDAASDYAMKKVIDKRIVERNEARAAKDWAEADRIRDELAEMGITLEDGPEGTKWHWARQ